MLLQNIIQDLKRYPSQLHRLVVGHLEPYPNSRRVADAAGLQLFAYIGEPVAEIVPGCALLLLPMDPQSASLAGIVDFRRIGFH